MSSAHASETCHFPSSLPKTLQGFRNYHAGETFLVCGCGASLPEVVAPERFLTIGVNDVGRLFHPDYLVVLNPRHQFMGDRYRHVEESRARAIFSQLPLGLRHSHVVPIRLGRRGGTDDADPNVLHYTRNSPYLALGLAMHMGAARIGLIGVDFTENHFFARTGQHPLSREFDQIDREYKFLAEAATRRGVEIFNLSESSRLTPFAKMSPERFAAETFVDHATAASVRDTRVFFVHYRFQSCGDVFQSGLENAAADLGIEYDGAYWNDPNLPERVERFSPNLLFVVHGRKFAAQWKNRFAGVKSAVWLVDEPYEVDDTSRFSGLFNAVFLNDPKTLTRHKNSHYLPVAYNPHACVYRPGEARQHFSGFIGGWNRTREQMLAAVAQKKLLSYVVGPWREPALRALLLSGNIPADQTPALYRQTQVVLNIFRTAHHFNRSGIEAFSLNPRVYEAAACGALVVSERRPELDELWPDALSFESAADLISTLSEIEQDPLKLDDRRRDCVHAFRKQTYAARLAAALTIALDTPAQSLHVVTRQAKPQGSETARPAPEPAAPAGALGEEWEPDASVVSLETDGTIVLQKGEDSRPGSEQGLIGKTRFENLVLSFEVFIERGASFIAKIHQEEARDQRSNSYHVFSKGRRAYLARHHYVLCSFITEENSWLSLKLAYRNSRVSVQVNDGPPITSRDNFLPSGYCFLGVKGGRARLRNITARTAAQEPAQEEAEPPRSNPPEHVILSEKHLDATPEVSIVTTVYDRVECLERCLRSVNALSFSDYEHIVVADCPAPGIVNRLRQAVEKSGHAERRMLANLLVRHNNWGIAPAATGLALARGKYVAFLSDDNGYLPDHFQPLVNAMQKDPEIGFAYSSCLYAGRLILRNPFPRPGGIDLGQPLFRRHLFDLHLNGTLPFTQAAWDWHMIELLLRKGVRWKHIDRSSFVFRLAKYPHLVSALP